MLPIEGFRDSCKDGYKDILNVYCLVGAGISPIVLNPWFGGEYNPTESCDTVVDNYQERIDGVFDAEFCFASQDSTSCLNKLGQIQDTIPINCNVFDGLIVTNPRISRNADVDLCKKSESFATQCHSRSKLLGGGVGKAVEDLYVDSGFQCSPETATFFTNLGLNPLYYNVDVEDACLQFGPDEVGPNAIWLSLRNVGSEQKLLVDAVGLSPDLNQTARASSWAYTLGDECAADLEAYERVYGGANWTFSTPFERLTFWLGQHPRKPLLPDPSRARVMFSRGEGGCNGASPLQGAYEAYTAAPATDAPRTPDGFCWCSSFSSCSTSCASVPWSRIEAATARPGSFYEIATDLDSDDSFYDWPQAAGVLRDGGGENARIPLTNGVASRLPPPYAAYRPTAVDMRQRLSGKTTLSEGGDCHMGRAALDEGAFDLSKCQLVAKDKDTYTFECVDSNGNYRHETLPRMVSRAPSKSATEMRKKRTQCNACSVPGFTTVGALNEPETSFGVPLRLAPARRVMRELQELMREYNITNAWGSPSVASDREHFVDSVLRPAALAAMLRDDSAMLAELRARFDEGWVFCTQQECNGSIAYDEWSSASISERLDMCHVELMRQSNNGKDLVVEVEMCDMDSTLDEVCSLLRQANQTVFDANCMAAGLCVPDTFVYAPAVYSVSNNDFVRASVQNFYLRHDSTLCRASEDEEALRLQNIAEQQDCPSVAVHAFNELLTQMRMIAQTIARIIFYAYNLGISLFKVLIPGAMEQTVAEIEEWFNKLLAETMKLMMEMAHLVYKMIFEVSFVGQAIQRAYMWVCNKVAWLLEKFGDLWCLVITPFLDNVIDSFRDISNEISDFVNKIPFVDGYRFSVLDGIINGLNDLKNKVTGALCNGPLMECIDFPKNDGYDGDGALPAATRCWADFVPSAGIATSLACSRADTCVAEDLGSDKVMCDSCPMQDGVTFNNFGCNLLTKRCSCKTQTRSITYCSESSQCSLDAMCRLVDNPFASTAWGVDLCSACATEAICVFDGSESIGQCACPYTPPRVEMCAADAVGATVFVSPSAMCHFTFSDDIARGATTSVAAASLAVVPCSVIDSTTAVCVLVDWQPLVVAFRVRSSLAPSRRLLGLPITEFLSGSAANQELAEAIVQFADWNRTAEPCRSLVGAHYREEALGPVDVYVLQQCIFWRMVGNMTRGVPDTLFMSLEDTMNAIVDDPTVLLKALSAVGDTVRAVLTLWPPAGNFIARVAPLLDGRNDSWLVLARDVLTSSGRRRRRDAANWDAYVHLAEQHSSRRLLMETPRFEDLTEEAIQADIAAKEVRYYAQLSEYGVLGNVEKQDVAGLLLSGAIFTASGFDDFLASRQPDPTLPTYDYWVDSDGDGQLDWNTCPAVAIMVEEMKTGFGLLRRFYSDGYRRLKPTELLNFSAALPRVRVGGGEVSSAAEPTSGGLVNNAIFVVAEAFQRYTGVTSGKLAGFLRCYDDEDAFSLCNFVRRLFKCDKEAVQLCSRRDHTIYIGIPVCLVFFLLLSYVLSLVGFGALSFWLWTLFPFFVTWYTYGYSPRCFPMVPTCLVEDLVLPVYYLVPRQLRVSDALQRVPGCWQDDSFAPEDCLRSCVADPIFNYQSLTATYAQLLCETYGPECTDSARFEPPEWLHWLIDPQQLRVDLVYKAHAQKNYYDTFKEDDLVAQRFCAFAGVMFALPYVVAVWVVLLLALALPVLLLRLLVASVQVLLQMIFFSHMAAS